MATQQTRTYNLVLDEDERAQLLRLLEQCLTEVHMERRRTEGPDYHDRVIHEESLIRTLTEKVRALAPE